MASKIVTLLAGTVIGLGCGYLLFRYIDEREVAAADSLKGRLTSDSVSKSAVTGKRTGLRRSLTLKKKHTIEICLSDIQSLRNAIAGGCNSVELCVDRSGGGVTASIGLIEQAAAAIGGKDISLHILIRPRAGGFCYTDDEFDIIQRDIIAAKLAGADGIVFGALLANGTIDIPRMKLIRELSKGLLLTFHRAFDVCSEALPTALETLISLGCDRLLTSGGAQSNALANAEQLRQLQEQAQGRFEIVAAAGVSEHNAAELLQRTGLWAVHAGSAVCSTVVEPSPPPSSSSNSSAGGPGINSDHIAIHRASPGLESFVQIGMSEVTSSTPRGSTAAAASAESSPVSPSSSALQELRSWKCTSEDLVGRLVSVVKATLALRAQPAKPANTVAETDAAAAESGYVHL